MFQQNIDLFGFNANKNDGLVYAFSPKIRTKLKYLFSFKNQAGLNNGGKINTFLHSLTHFFYDEATVNSSSIEYDLFANISIFMCLSSEHVALFYNLD